MESRIDKAYRVLGEAEQALSDLIAESLREQRFGEVQAIAALAEKVTTALHTGTTEREAQRRWLRVHPRRQPLEQPSLAGRSLGVGVRKRAIRYSDVMAATSSSWDGHGRRRRSTLIGLHP